MTVQIIEISGQKMAILPVADYDRLMEIAEDRADEIAAEAAERRRDNGEEYVPSEMVDRMIAGESALKVWREYRGLSAAALAEASHVHPSTISKLERGQRGGKPGVWRALATALGVSPDDIAPVIGD